MLLKRTNSFIYSIRYPNIDIPCFQTMESTLQRRRRSKIPCEPHSLSEAAIQFERTDFCKSYRGNFFRKHMKFNGCEMLIFISPGLMEEKMSQIETFHIDNSFQILPQGLSQLIIIHLVQEEHVSIFFLFCIIIVYILCLLLRRHIYIQFFIAFLSFVEFLKYYFCLFLYIQM